MNLHVRLFLSGLWIFIPLTLILSCTEEKIDFSTQVKPILNKRCIACHGGVKRNGGFSLLFAKDALDTTESGKHAIIPYDSKNSEMIRRILLTDPEERMPLKEEPLSKEEIDILTKWIDQGAKWGDHWAYVAPKDIPLPHDESVSVLTNAGKEWTGNPIDKFVAAKLKEQDLQPSPEAQKETLIRRVYLDLVGIPPTQEEVQKLIGSNDSFQYERLVDQLLASPHFGEKWASWWLDLARYSDTKGYERDVGRNMWRYRDWVIHAFNDDLPFDEFTIQQLAGDLLPDPTDNNLIATGFHRNTMNNDEGGTEDEEFRIAALLDRVSTTWEVWQSTTMSCVQCHAHPYDPFRHEEFYKALAFFNNTRDEDTHGEHPNLRKYMKEDSINVEAIRSWVEETEGKERQKEITMFLKTLEPKYHPHDFDQFINGELIDTKFLGIRPTGSARLKGINLTGKDMLIINYLAPAGSQMEIHADSLSGLRIAAVDLPETKGWKRRALIVPLQNLDGVHDLHFVFQNKSIKPDQAVADIEWFAFRPKFKGEMKEGYEMQEKKFLAVLNAEVENTPVMVENTLEQHRDTYIFDRGNWLVRGDKVEPGVPNALSRMPSGQRLNRLSFAKWLASEENPLTSRVIVNRIWEQLFGYGLVETLEDFGTQGAKPSHPELLDWLAIRLMKDYKWSLKALIKQVVMSSTYRQSSYASAEAFANDPTNKWLARGPRVRLSAEQVRDQALSVSGLLSKKMYGKSVMPYQPEGIWNSVWSGEYWKRSEGEDQYRRSVYTYTKRTSPYPSAVTFDASSREVCLSRRIRTNTPLQALVTLNDSTYIVAARALASKMQQSAAGPLEQIKNGYKQILYRDIPERKLKILINLYDDAFTHYSRNKADAQKLCSNKSASAELAATVVVAQTLLNLDEMITKE
jgi:hypothetical protein